jgi:hypothetical protein
MENYLWHMHFSNVIHSFVCYTVKEIKFLKQLFSINFCRPTVKTLCDKTNSNETSMVTDSRLISRSLHDRQSFNSFSI